MRYHQPDLVLFTECKRKDVKTPYNFEGPMSGREYMRHNNLRGSAWGYIFGRQALGSLRFREGSTVEDEEFTPQLILRCEVVYVTTAEAYYYRQGRVPWFTTRARNIGKGDLKTRNMSFTT